MDEQTLINQRFTITRFFQKIFHHFAYGNAPYNDGVFDPHSDFSASWGLPYDSHPGPIEEAITDAKNLNRSLFVFIYCKENALTQRCLTVLSQPSICEEIQRSFLFLPLDVTTPQGIVVANALNFNTLPLIALIRPRGTTLNESQIFVKHEGKIGESILLSYIRVEHQEQEEQQAHAQQQAMVEEQDLEYREALEREQERQRQIRIHEEEEEMHEEMQKVLQQTVDEAFDALPPPPSIGEKVTVKFQFPDNNNQIRVFPRDGPVSMFFTFARKFVFPKDFILKIGFPPAQISETNEPISSVITDKQFICYVEYDE